jgi:hypothetical protein
LKVVVKNRIRRWHVLIFVAIGVTVMLAYWPRRNFTLLSDENRRKCWHFTTQAEYEALLGPPNSSQHSAELKVGPRPARILSWEDRATVVERFVYGERRNAPVLVRWLDASFDEETDTRIDVHMGGYPVYWESLWQRMQTWMRPGEIPDPW